MTWVRREAAPSQLREKRQGGFSALLRGGNVKMGHVPGGATWYLATIVQEISVEDEPQSVIHKNLVLVRASSPDEAYENACELGKESEINYENPRGKPVRIAFKGLNELNVIHDELEHGGELRYEELIGLSTKDIESMLRQKKDLSVFRPITPTEGPDYSSREVLRDVAALIKKQ
jgi:hypothetical protein